MTAQNRKLSYLVEQEGGEVATVMGERRCQGGTQVLARWADGVRQWLYHRDIGAPAHHVEAFLMLVPRAYRTKSLEDVLDDALEECPDLPEDWRPGNVDAFLSFTEAFLQWRRNHDLPCASLPLTEFRCEACGREEGDCSLNPCAVVRQDRLA